MAEKQFEVGGSSTWWINTDMIDHGGLPKKQDRWIRLKDGTELQLDETKFTRWLIYNLTISNYWLLKQPEL
jgi:hypothetical protein